MADEIDKPSSTASRPAPDEKAERLAAQLRRNLQRRKAQGRARRAADDSGPEDSGPDSSR